MTRLVGVLLCAIAIFYRGLQTVQRAGKPVVDARIIDYAEADGMSARNFIVRYMWQGKEITAHTLESVSAPYSGLPERYINRACQVYVDEKNPALVSLKGNHTLDILCGILLALGLIGIILG